MKKTPLPTVAESLSQAHLAFLEDLGQLEQAVDPDAGGGVTALRRRLAATLVKVTGHFRFEEQGGYMDAVRKREPRLERAIQQLEAEHHELLRSLETLIGEAGAAARLDDSLGEKVRAWLSQVRHHEARENDLVLDTFNQDISAED
jgi:hypothetical protein